MQVVSDLAGRRDVPSFRLVEVNGMRLSQPSQVFVEIHSQLMGDVHKKISAHNAQARLCQIFDPESAADGDEDEDEEGEQRQPTVLVVDEVTNLSGY